LMGIIMMMIRHRYFTRPADTTAIFNCCPTPE